MEMFLCNNILKNLHSLPSPYWNLEEQLRSLEMVVSNIKRILPDAEDKEDNDSVGAWLRKLRPELYEADDLVEEIAHVGLHKQRMGGDQVRLFFSPFYQLAFFAKMVKSVQNVKDRMEGIMDEGTGFGFVDRPIIPWERCPSVGLDRIVVGRALEMEELVRLLRHDDVDEVKFVGIEGLGGVEKTVLAELVYYDISIRTHFELRIWVHVGHLFDIGEIARKIVECSTKKKPPQDLDMNKVETLLRGEIHGKRFLLVLDDVWEENQEKWLQLRAWLRRGARGSKILLTTRSNRVASLHSSMVLRQQCLSGEKSWALFKTLAIIDNTPNRTLIELGERITRMCANHPLAIKIVASFLRGQREEVWVSACDKMRLRGLDDCPLDVTIRYACTFLPMDLKPYLASCLLFPKGHELNKHDLISLWVAQGFVEQQEESQSLEDAAEEHYKDLLRRGFLDVGQRDEVGNIITCHVHDLIHDLAILVPDGETLVLETKTDTRDYDRVRHVAVNYAKSSIPSSMFQARKMRTLLRLNTPGTDIEGKSTKPECNKILSNWRRLRMLDMRNYGIKELPDSIAKLISLRHLDLSNNFSLIELPESITGLYHLRTLKLNFCEKLKRLPKGIEKLLSLRNLEVHACDELTGIPVGLQKLTCLQTLSDFIVGKDASDPRRNGGLSVLNRLNNLRGSLRIHLSGESPTALEEAASAKLGDKTKLSELSIDWGLERPHQVHRSNYLELLKGINALTNLVALSIDGCKECEHLPEFGRLPKLRRLTLRHMDGVQYMDSHAQPSNEMFFPSLRELTLNGFYNLESWWKTQQGPFPIFARLIKLKIWNCPKLVKVPLFSKVEDLDLLNISQKLLPESRTSSGTMEASSSVISYSSSRSYSKRNSFHNLPSLESLQVKRCPDLTSFPALAVSEEGASSLKYLAIDMCNELNLLAEGLQHFTSLRELEISSCEKLDFSSENQEDGNPWRSLSNLGYLTFRDIPKMKNLPDGLRHVSTLRFLCISSCHNVASLPKWIGSLTSLIHLRIECCQTLTELPNALSELNSLDKVEINECPELVERCREHVGKEWPKIKHVRELFLHKSWRYGLLSNAEQFQRQQRHKPEDDVVAKLKDGVLHVTISNFQSK